MKNMNEGTDAEKREAEIGSAATTCSAKDFHFSMDGFRDERLMAFAHSIGQKMRYALSAIDVESVLVETRWGFLLRFSGLSLGIMVEGGIDEPYLNCLAFKTNLSGHLEPWNFIASEQRSIPTRTDWCCVCDHRGEGVQMPVCRSEWGGFHVLPNAEPTHPEPKT